MNHLDMKKVIVDAIINELFDQGYTPHVVVRTSGDNFIGPTHLANEHGFTIFSLGLSAVRNYDVNDLGISFNATFGGKGYFCDLHYSDIAGVYPKEEPEVFFPFAVEPEVIDAEYEELTDEEPELPVSHTTYHEDNVIELCPGAEPWRNPHANPDWAKSATVK